MTLETYRRTRSEQKRAAIMDAGMLEFQRSGFANATMETIASTAGVSTATLYRHFRSKDDLFEAVSAEAIVMLQDALPEETSSPITDLKHLAHAYATLLCAPSTRAIMRMIIAETGRNTDLAERFYTSTKSRLSSVFETAVMRAIKTGEIREHSTPSRSAGLLQGMIEHGTLMRGLIMGDDAPPGEPIERIVESAIQTWLAGWAT